ncbi:APC family permease [Sulfolobus sp. S-194]|uniref:APC family permease n=1 Tax=Sulfolobus sp. S-194 TaxID=2512240 RepID=UPI001436FFC1|nr:APC family permease [Sulfolobus sp. S-194]
MRMVNLSKKLEPKENTIPRYLIYAQSLSSIAPLGSASAYLTYALQYSLSSTFIAGIFGVLIYFLWVLIGYEYSKVIASTGGIYEFARRSGGELLGKIAGWLYWISYAIYLPSATTYLTGIVITSEFSFPPVMVTLIEILIPIVLTLLLLSGIRPPLFYALLTSTIEVILIFILGIKVISITGFSLNPLKISVPVSDFFSGALAVGFTLAGGGASFFLGYEAIGKGKTVAKSYLYAYWIASISVLFASYFEIAFAGYSNSGMENLLNVTQYPAYYIAQKLMGNSMALLIFIFTINSLIGSVTAAYVALSRLTYSLLRKDMLKSILAVALFFLLINLIAGITGEYSLVYSLTTEASLVTLYGSHVIVSALFPLFSRKMIGFRLYHILLSFSAVILMGYGVYSNIVPYSGLTTLVGILSLIGGVIIGIISWGLEWRKLNMH